MFRCGETRDPTLCTSRFLCDFLRVTVPGSPDWTPITLSSTGDHQPGDQVMSTTSASNTRNIAMSFDPALQNGQYTPGLCPVPSVVNPDDMYTIHDATITITITNTAAAGQGITVCGSPLRPDEPPTHHHHVHPGQSYTVTSTGDGGLLSMLGSTAGKPWATGILNKFALALRLPRVAESL